MDAEFIDYVLSLIVTMSATYWILRFDEIRLSETQLERAWPASSRNAAVLAFSPICLLIHFARTRRTFVGALLGVAAVAAIVGTNLVLTLAIEAIAGR